MKQMAIRTKVMAIIGAALVAVLALSGVAWAATALAVTKTVPSAGATGIARTVNVQAYFNHDMKASTITSSTFKIRKQGTTTWLGATRSVNNTISPTSTNRSSQSVVTLNPNADLALNTTYQVVIVGGSSGVKDLNGQALGATKSWTFTTVAPPNTTINSGPSGAVASTSASFSFSSSKAGSTFKCSLDGSTFAGCASPKTYSSLSQGNHTFRVQAIDTSGIADPTPASRSWTVDTVGPNATITDGPPSRSNSLLATFAFSGAESGGSYQCKINDASSSGTFSACTSGQSFTVDTDGTYTFSVRASDALGNVGTPASRSWTVDTVAPTVDNLSPADAATGVAPSTNVTAIFSEGMNSSSISGQTFTLKEQGSLSQLGATVTYDSTTKKATLDPSANLAPNTTYTATLTTGVQDSAGNTLAQERSWTFTTDIARPTVVSYEPTGSSPPGLSTNVTATFSTAMDPSTITTSTFTLTRSGSSVPLAAQVTYDSASKTATLNPDGSLSDSTNYTAVIKSGSDGVRDLQGNSLAQDFSWTFMACDGGIVLSAQSMGPLGVVVCG